MSLVHPQFHASRCTRYRYRYSECARCLEACPHEAIQLTDAGAELDAARCQNCALCTAACHTGAWASGNFKPLDLLRAAIKQPAFSMACAPSGQAADAIVPCLGAIAPGVAAYLGKRGIPLSLLGGEHCPQCPHGSRGAAQLAQHLEAAAALRAAAGAAWAALATPQGKPAGGAHAPGRRQFFRRLAGRAAGEADMAASGQSPPPPPPPESAIRAGAYLSSEQRQLLQIVCERKEDQAFMLAWHPALPLMQITLNSGCTACEACFRVCPAHALRVVENPGDWALEFDFDRCLGCAVCLEVCQPHVLDAAADFDARPERPPQVLHRLVKQRCKRCDRFFVSPTAADTCHVCHDDEDAFAAIYG